MYAVGMADPEKLALLQQSIEEYNAWRHANPGAVLDLTDANLNWLDLAHADLRQCFLRGAQLYRTNLKGAHLDAACMERADLRYADLSHAELIQTQLTGANLCNANLSSALLMDADLSGANLSGVNREGADFSGASGRGRSEPEPDIPPARREQLEILGKGVAAWNQWRDENPDTRPALNRANLKGMRLDGVNLSGAELNEADLSSSSLEDADLSGAFLFGANLRDARLVKSIFIGAELAFANLAGAEGQGAFFKNATLYKANLAAANLREANCELANFTHANASRALLPEARLFEARLHWTNLSQANLEGAELGHASLFGASVWRANLKEARLVSSVLSHASLRLADLTGVVLNNSTLVGTDFSGANLTGSSIHGIAAWDLQMDDAIQSNLLITSVSEAPLRVDDLEMAQFVYLLMSRQKLRNVITTMGEKAVLILGRFTERKELLDQMADKLRARGFLPMIFDFERPTDRDLTETVKILAGLSRFVIADITNPRSVPLELQATVPDYMVPFVTILERGQPAFGMFDDLPRKYHWALPLLEYKSAETLLAAFDHKIVGPALEKADEIRREKGAGPVRRSAED